MDRKLQRHRADSLRQHGFLVTYATSLGLSLGLIWPRPHNFLSASAS